MALMLANELAIAAANQLTKYTWSENGKFFDKLNETLDGDATPFFKWDLQVLYTIWLKAFMAQENKTRYLNWE